MNEEMDIKEIDLIWPAESKKKATALANQSNLLEDLGLRKLFKQMSVGRRYNFSVENIIKHFTVEADVIKYRLQLIDDLLENPEIVRTLKDILPMIQEQSNIGKSRFSRESDLKQLVSRISELEIYVNCVDRLYSVLTENEDNIKSEAFKLLLQELQKIAGSESFQNLKKELPEFKKGFEGLKSVTVGINLDAQLRPEEAVLVSVNDQTYTAGNILDRLLKLDFTENKFRGISKLETVVKDNQSARKYSSLSKALINNLEQVMKSVIRSVSPQVAKFNKTNTNFLLKLKPGILFYLGAIKFLKKVKKSGLSLCKPEVAARDERKCYVKNSYNLLLALDLIDQGTEEVDEEIVKNEINFADQGRIFILTGPNRGGKTTHTQAVGQIQIFFQLGFPVPGQEAVISPADNVYTHFPVEEKPGKNLGRLGEECQRLKEIFNQASPHSLILLNESLSSTSPGEGLYIAREIITGFKIMEARVMYATHFHELATGLDKINEEVPGDSKLVSLVAGLEENEEGESVRTYKIEQSPPQGVSYARDIAHRFGVSLEQIYSQMKERDIIEEDLSGLIEQIEIFDK